MKTHVSNAAYGVLDYAVYPIGMLAVAPVMLRTLGVEQYGVWIVATAVVSTGSILASGFGDANIQRIAMQRGFGDRGALIRVVRSTMGIHLVLGTSIAIALWLLAPSLSRHVAPLDAGLQNACRWSFRIAGILTFVRAIETVCVSTHRAFERYGAAVRISILARILTLVAAAVLSIVTRSVVDIMAVTALLAILGLHFQLTRLKKFLQCNSLTPAFDRATTKALLSFGIFSWLQAASGVLFGQADKLIMGVSLGAAAVASYALCVQMVQPVYGLAASGLHFLFPYLSGQSVAESAAAFRRALVLSLAANLAFIALGTTSLILFGSRLLVAFGGEAIAISGTPALPLIACGTGLLGLNVTGTYALLALGRVQTVTWINLAGGAAMMLLIARLLPGFGVYGVAVARLVYGLIGLLLYIPLLSSLRSGAGSRLSTSTAAPVCEEA